ncbi:uncharacterized protein LOC125232157 [Leguminivora glycinivorella]|uniref:uncharacterized protein LOC125232157 n=1 Tax=Leguminivora glycinivorella TaxID=1035111 RepID=UPI00200D8BB4|nr:uncharacterized protein LOC125232157 [Leguminivora glycinivorella]
MLLFILSISVHLASARFLVSMPVMRVIYGNISTMADLAVPPPSRRADLADLDDISVGGHDENEIPEFQEFMNEIEDLELWSSRVARNSSAHDFDIKDVSDISRILANISQNLKVAARDQQESRRKFESRRQSANDQLYLPREVDTLWPEPVKLREWYYMKFTLSLLIHVRFQMDIAFRQKMVVNDYPGYRIGYLFSRMMKIRTQMFRLLEEYEAMKRSWTRETQARPNWRTKKHNLLMMLQLYERMLQLDVDAKDAGDLIKFHFYGRDQFVTQLNTPATTVPFFKRH